MKSQAPHVDLHVHSNCSDGTFSPSQLVDYAMQKNLRAFALTDHDTVDGLDEAIEYADKLRKEGFNPPEVIPGIEFSTEYQGKDVHIIGLYIKHQKPEVLPKLQEFVDARINRNKKMCGLLQDAGIDISYEKLVARFPDCVITRGHYAQYLKDHGYVQNMQEAFDRYIGDQCPYFVPREKVTPIQAIQLILEADGIPVLAHPILYHLSDARLEQLVAECKEAGLIGIEAIYATYNAAEERQIRQLASKYHLLISGGSDFHGSIKPGLDLGNGYGKLYVPETVLMELKASRSKLLFTDMDGTLLNDKGEISPAMKQALDELTARGHHLILTSGRPLPSILKVCEGAGIHYPNMLIISNNGALVYDCDARSGILSMRLDIDDIRYIVEEANKINLHIHAYTETEVISQKLDEEVISYVNRVKLPVKCVDNIPDSLPNSSFKLLAIHLTDRKILEDFRNHISKHCGDRMQIIFSNDQYLEMLPMAAGKGNALLFVEEYLHIPHSHTFAAGDAENDISMIQAAGTGIAMQNASQQVKEIADIVTKKDNDHDGLIEIINQYFRSL